MFYSVTRWNLYFPSNGVEDMFFFPKQLGTSWTKPHFILFRRLNYKSKNAHLLSSCAGSGRLLVTISIFYSWINWDRSSVSCQGYRTREERDLCFLSPFTQASASTRSPLSHYNCIKPREYKTDESMFPTPLPIQRDKSVKQKINIKKSI